MQLAEELRHAQTHIGPVSRPEASRLLGAHRLAGQDSSPPVTLPSDVGTAVENHCAHPNPLSNGGSYE